MVVIIIDQKENRWNQFIMRSLLVFVCMCVCACSSSSTLVKNADDVPIPSIEPALEVSDEVPAEIKDGGTHESKLEVCPEGMVEIEGEHCDVAQEICLYNVDIDGKRLPGTAKDSISCGEFQFPTKCLSGTHHMHFCLDQFEFPNKRGQIPQDWMTWYDVKRGCEAQGKRLVKSMEWEFACEGPNLKPYPYGDGYHRTHDCNIDNHLPVKGIDVFKATSPSTPTAKILHDMLVPSGSMPNCKSDFGIYDQSGNIDEIVLNESGYPYRSAMMGGHQWHVRQRCRARTLAHSETFSWYESGGRCSKDVVR